MRVVTIVIRAVNRRGMYSAHTESGRLLVRSSSVPFCDAARELIRIGYSPESMLVMRREGSQVEALRGRIGPAAGLTVEDGRFVPHRPRVSGCGTPTDESDEGSEGGEPETGPRGSPKAEAAE